MVLEAEYKDSTLVLKFNDKNTKNSISSNDWIEFRKKIKDFDEYFLSC